MLSELHLKFHSETGTKATRQIYSSEYDEDSNPVILPDNETEMNIPTDEYLEWIEMLALKQIKRDQPLHAEIKRLRAQLHEACDRLNQHGLL